ncbi:MAG TPA: hypothetical protein VKA84_04600, partial [Gemmatimonadaceae bacterium]|nr:hypothetical protein [Gemmatimonadaceae bacterium]
MTPLALRALALYLPLLAAAGLWWWRANVIPQTPGVCRDRPPYRDALSDLGSDSDPRVRDDSAAWAPLLSLAWNLLSLPALHLLAARYGW